MIAEHVLTRRVGAGQQATGATSSQLAGHTLIGVLEGGVAGAVVGWLIKRPVPSAAIGAAIGGIASFLLNK